MRTDPLSESEEELARDVERLSVQWEEVQEKAKTASPPSLLYGEPDMTVRVIRDIFNEDFKKVVISGSDAWQVVDDYVASVAPDLRDRVTNASGLDYAKVRNQRRERVISDLWLGRRQRSNQT